MARLWRVPVIVAVPSEKRHAEGPAVLSSTASGAIVQDARMNVSGDWTAHHFSQANPAGRGQEDIPALLRRVADTIEGLGEVQIMDLVMHNEITAEGDWPSMTVYYKASS